MLGYKWVIKNCIIRLTLLSCISLPAFSQNNSTVQVKASDQYSKASFLQKLFFGSNYRKLWATPATMTVFDIGSVQGGMQIEELGGGEQTKSLSLKDKNGIEWSLRMVDKDVTLALPSQLRNTFIKPIVQDLISAGHPYGALSVPFISDAAGVVTGSESLYFVPDDPALGQYRSMFANTVCILVRREPLPEAKELYDTQELLEKMKAGNIKIEQKAVLRARLVDMLIADWDRHEGQLRWASRDSAGSTWFYPVPRDRDQAYFNSNGILVKLFSFLFFPHVKGFTKNSRGIKNLSRKSWEFDKMFMNELTQEDWENIITSFQKEVSDSVIHISVSALPPEIVRMNGAELEEKLKNRRNGLLKHVMRYRRFLFEH